MSNLQNSKSFRHFAKHFFLIGRVYVERKKAKEDVDNYLQRMIKSIIRMNLSYSDIDKLKKKIENLLDGKGSMRNSSSQKTRKHRH